MQNKKKSRLPLWRRKANYVLRELVRAWHGLPYDTAVLWGLGYAFEDILRTFAKENDLDFSQLELWFELAWSEFAKNLGERVFTALDRRKYIEVLVLVFPKPKLMLCGKFVYSKVIRSIMLLSSMLFLREVGKKPSITRFTYAKWPLRYYESLDVVALDSFEILYIREKYGI
jgi:hypothetical protein